VVAAARRGDPRAPLFFLSYAHSSQGPTEHERQVVKFFNDLSEIVSQLVDRVPGQEMGFIDRSIRDGSRWTDDVLDALGSCRVCVALLSRPYATSSWCGMEWHAFSQRKVTARPGSDAVGNQTPIFPVLWAPVPEQDSPPAIQKVQRFAPSGFRALDLERKYNELGVLGVMETSGRRNTYKCIVWSLAQSIANFANNHDVERQVFREADLRDVFGKGMP
jgi:hypothetical protein